MKRKTNIIVVLFTSVYFNNIGNGFIDLGAEFTLKEVLPQNHVLIKISQCANFAASMGKKFILKEVPFINRCWRGLMKKNASKLHDQAYSAISTLDVNSVASIMNFDYLVIPGCVLTVPFFTIYGKLLKNKVQCGVKIVFLGVGGNFYTEDEVEIVSEWLKKLKPMAIITRDTLAFKYYSSYAEYSYSGIDNAFFANMLKIPPICTSPKNYVIVNLEEAKHIKIKQEIVKALTKEGKNIIYTNHKPFPYLNLSKMVKEGVVVSDYPLDYLILYRNAEVVYSDRIHACIAALSFGNRAFLYSDSPRRVLFDNVGITKINTKEIITNNLLMRQKNQIKFLSDIFNIQENASI